MIFHLTKLENICFLSETGNNLSSEIQIWDTTQNHGGHEQGQRWLGKASDLLKQLCMTGPECG
jgi:hypothetical protein